MDEDALKKNTDCVYFLASPLTCKKGNDCEFRHSESARVNPRDCRYWLGGNCLNWDCPFRHPPLEGRPTVALSTAAAPGGASKSRVPCYFFSQGFCAKGEKCPFMHGTLPSSKPPPAASKPVKLVAAGSTPEANEKETGRPASNGGEAKLTKVPTVETHLPSESRPTQGGGVQSIQKDVRVASVPTTQNGGARGRAELPGVSSGLGGSRLRLRQVQAGDERVQNGMEPDEWWEESSPGFDVLVNDVPDPTRHADDPEFQSAGETGMDSGKIVAGNRGRGGRSMHMTDDMEQYDYDYSNHYDHGSGYDGGPSYEHAYEYDVHEQQGGYDPSNTYDRVSHQRASVYADRLGADEALARERLGLPMDVDMRSGGGAHDQRARIIKRRRDGGQQHLPENHSRRQRIDVPMDEYQHHHQRQQEDQQKQHEAQLRHQLFIQHGMRNNNRRVLEKTGLEPSVIARRALHDIGAPEGVVPPLERIPLKGMPKGRSSVDHPRSGVKEVDIHSRLSKAGDAFVEAESRNYMDLEGNRKSEKDVRKEPSTFAGPKSLAQIRAEKRKNTVEEPPKVVEVSNGLRKPGQSNVQSKVQSLRSQLQQSPVISVPDVVSPEALSVEERKVKLDKVVAQEVKKGLGFQGPKSLSAILKEKRRVDSEIDSKTEETSIDHLERILPPVSRVAIASRVEGVSGLDSHIQDVEADIGGGIGNAEVEDGEFLSEDDEPLKVRSERSDNETHSLAALEDGGESVATRSQWQEDVTEAPECVQGEVEEHMVEGRSNGAELERNEDGGQGYEGHENEDGKEEILEPEQDEDVYALDEDEDDDDDFAKKLGGFFT